MIRIFYAALFVAPSLLTQAQVPNGGYETWTGNVPDNWSTNNIEALDAVTITPSSDAHTGSLAARGEVIPSPLSTSPVVSPTLQTNGGVLVTSDPTNITGWYKFEPAQASTRFVVSATAVDVNGLVTGTGVVQYAEAQNGYAQFSCPINYGIGQSDPVERVTISFIISDVAPAGALGSWFLVDDIAFDGATGIETLDLLLPSLAAPFPSPFSVSTTLPVTLNSTERIDVEIVDLLGKQVEHIAHGAFTIGDHRFAWEPKSDVPNGVYFIRVTNSAGSIAKRVVLQR
jgi:hypothetical protein